MAYRRSSHVTSAALSAIVCNDDGLYLLDALLCDDGDGDDFEEDDDEAFFLFESLSDIFVTVTNVN